MVMKMGKRVIKGGKAVPTTDEKSIREYLTEYGIPAAKYTLDEGEIEGMFGEMIQYSDAVFNRLEMSVGKYGVEQDICLYFNSGADLFPIKTDADWRAVAAFINFVLKD